MEVFHDGEWGTVCDDEWDLNDAQVICNELGYGKAIDARPSGFYGWGSGEIWLDNLNCGGTEDSVVNCSHGGWGYHNCHHGEDAGVKCSAGNC